MVTSDLLLRVNGIQPAFGIEFGSASPRSDEGRRDPYRQANVSFSVIQRQGADVLRHTLIDCGMGIVPSLLEFERSHGVHVIHETFISHLHFDHFAGLDWLTMCTERNGRPDQPRPLPIYATPPTWENGPARVFSRLADRTIWRPLVPWQPVPCGDVTVTPFPVEHGPSAPGAVGFVVQHGSRKIVMTCDFRSVPDEDHPLLKDADVCFMEANTWHPVEWLAHQSVLGALRLVQKWRPKRTYLLHYSGYEDRNFPDDPIHEPLAFGRAEQELAKIRGDMDVHLARHGMVLGDDTAWPC
jgi:phosphoribosyl 1,2-cyclic phosphodiesterase